MHRMHTFITSMDDQNALQHSKYCNAGILQTTRYVDTKCQQSSTCQQQANWAALAAAAFASVPMRPLRLRRAAKGGGWEGGSVKLPRAPRQTYTCRSVQRPAQPGPTRVFKKNLLALELFHKRTGVRHDWTECWLGSLRGNYTGHESPIKSNDT